MLHVGVCIDRHYCAFAGVRHGQNTANSFADLVKVRFATACRCARERARILRLQNRAQYAAIGEATAGF